MPSPSAVGQALLEWQSSAMASQITLQAPAAERGLPSAVEAAFAVFSEIERDCTRFGDSGALVGVNREPDRWHRVPPALFAALREAFAAHLATGGLFDPRVHDALVDLGYDRSFHEVVDASPSSAPTPRRPTGAWAPRFVAGLRMVHLGGVAADLGGIGKGLAVRNASRVLSGSGDNFLIEAGGDLYAAGRPAPDETWAVGVESPSGGEGPVAVLEVRDVAVATSSVRIRQWRSGDSPVHHLIDPRTGRPGGGDLRSVTVVHPDPAYAEVWSKALFLQGPDVIATAAGSRGLAALWIDGSGSIATSEAMRPFLAGAVR